MYPTTVVDNFFSNPDEIRRYALSLNFKKDLYGDWPGYRTENLFVIDRDFYNLFFKKILSIYHDLGQSSNTTWVADAHFQLIDPYSKDKHSQKNTGWVHYDNTVLSGVVYLNPIIDINTGTSIFRLLHPDNQDKDSNVKQDLYKDNIDNSYDYNIEKHNSAFEELINVKNIYNRLIVFNGSEPHRANSFLTSSDSRLTLVFFIHKLQSDLAFPNERHKKYL